MGYDSTVANSSGYFKDPGTKEDFAIGTPRVVKCSLVDSKFTWPMVMTSLGDPVKIVYKYFTDEEKELYKTYRGRPSTGASVQKRVGSSVPVAIKQDDNDVPTPNAIKEKVIKYDPNTAVSYTTEQLLNKATAFLGCSFISGVTYAIFTVAGSNQQYHIPRSVIPDSLMNRFYDDK